MQGSHVQVDDTAARLKQTVDFFCLEMLENSSMHTTISAMHLICAEIEKAIKKNYDENVVREILKPAFDLQSTSEFIKRLQTWPRGYAGDFETVEWIARPEPRIPKSDPAYWMEWYALNCSISQQHRNKLAWQRGLIERMAFEGGGRVLNIGCGGCADLSDSPSFLGNCDIVLVDMDFDAVALAKQRLKPARSVAAIQLNVFRGIREALAFGPFKLIICGGLFDYLPDGLIRKLLKRLTGSLDEDGELAFTNISDENPFRIWMEYLANWNLIHRNEEKMALLVDSADQNDLQSQMTKDPSGLAWLCLLKKL